MKSSTKLFAAASIVIFLACSGTTNTSDNAPSEAFQELTAQAGSDEAPPVFQTSEDAFYDHNDKGVEAMEAGLCDESIRELKAAVAVAERGVVPESELATALDNLGLAHKRCAHFEQAEASYQRALEIRERVLPAGHEDLAYVYNNIAGLHYSRGRYAEAERGFDKAFEIWKTTQGPDAPITLKARRNQGMALLRQGRAAEAELPLRYSLERCRVALGTHRDTASSLDGLSQALSSQDRFAEAEPLQLESLAMRTEVLGADHPVVGIGHGNVADLMIRQERWAEAEPYSRKALAILEAAYGSDHNDIATNAFNLALILENLGKNEEAERSYRRALEVDTKLFGADSDAAAIDRRYLADFLDARGRSEEAAQVRGN